MRGTKLRCRLELPTGRKQLYRRGGWQRFSSGGTQRNPRRPLRDPLRPLRLRSRKSLATSKGPAPMKSTQFDRRNFLSLAGKSLGLAALSSSTIASLLKEIHAATKTIAHLTPEQVAIDEDYWSTIQNAFTVTHVIINLNNRGLS